MTISIDQLADFARLPVPPSPSLVITSTRPGLWASVGARSTGPTPGLRQQIHVPQAHAVPADDRRQDRRNPATSHGPLTEHHGASLQTVLVRCCQNPPQRNHPTYVQHFQGQTAQLGSGSRTGTKCKRKNPANQAPDAQDLDGPLLEKVARVLDFIREIGEPPTVTG